MSARWVYKTLLRLYPGDYAASFGAEMASAFENGCEEHRRQGWAAFVLFTMAELVSVIMGFGTEWIARLTTDSSVRGRGLPDLRKMRPVGVPRELWFAAAGVNLGQSSLPLEAAEAQERLAFLVNSMVHAIADHDFQTARSYSHAEYRERNNLNILRKKCGLDR